MGVGASNVGDNVDIIKNIELEKNLAFEAENPEIMLPTSLEEASMINETTPVQRELH
uniref:Uncharacterized protein n=1 Tax=Arundo donax TaxID=35708 RepID=A0A0A9AP40_ARUDO